MNEAKLLRQVEMLAREVSAIVGEHKTITVEDEPCVVFDDDEKLLLRELRLALVQLDIARSESKARKVARAKHDQKLIDAINSGET